LAAVRRLLELADASVPVHREKDGGVVTIALGLDVSEKRMGWAAVDYDTQQPLALGVEALDERDGGWIENQVFRAMREVNKRIPPGEVFVVGVEDVYPGPNKMGALRHAGVVGMAQLAVRVVFGDVTIWPIPAGTWRKAIDLKPASRKRADVKAATWDWAMERLFGFDCAWDPETITNDATDALGIATACARLTVKNEAA
jgi:Holliday junction resolvasome RuvABC endonuclease subunit